MPTSEAAAGGGPARVTRARTAFVRAVVGLVAGLSLAAVAAESDRGWPFLAYSMFAAPRDPARLRAYCLVGVPVEDGPPAPRPGRDARGPGEATATAARREVPVDLEELLPGFGGYRLARALEDLRRREGPSGAARAMEELRALHERRRREGRAGGPALSALRVEVVRGSAPP